VLPAARTHRRHVVSPRSTAYFSLGMAKPQKSVLDEPVVLAAARTHEKSPAQVLLRWGVQRGTAVVPKTERPRAP